MTQSGGSFWQADGEPVPGYRLAGDAPVASGGSGTVWKAYGPGGTQIVALKRTSLLGPLGSKERESLTQLFELPRHPNLLRLHGHWVTDRDLIIAMDFADSNLGQELKRFPDGIPLKVLMPQVKAAAAGLDFLNIQCQVQHRDISPANLLMVGDVVVVGDFGFAKVMRGSVQSHSGGMSVQFAAPEFFRGETTRHSDQYSLAATYYLLRTGHYFRNFGSSQHEQMRCHLGVEPDVSDLPAAEAEVLLRALSKQANCRWPTCSELVDRLEAALQGNLNTPEDAVKRGMTALSNQNLPLAVAEFTSALEADPTLASAFQGRAGVYQRMNLPALAWQDIMSWRNSLLTSTGVRGSVDGTHTRQLGEWLKTCNELTGSMGAEEAAKHRPLELCAPFIPRLIEEVNSANDSTGLVSTARALKQFLRETSSADLISLFAAAHSGEAQESGLTAMLRLYLSTEDYVATLRLGRQIIQRCPQNFLALHLTARAALCAGRSSSSSDTRRRLEEGVLWETVAQATPQANASPLFAESQLQLAQLLHLLAVEKRKGPSKSWPSLLLKSLKLFQELLSKQPNSAVLTSYAEVLRDAEKHEEAYRIAQKASDLDWSQSIAHQLVINLCQRLVGQPRYESSRVLFLRHFSCVICSAPDTELRTTSVASFLSFLKSEKIPPALQYWTRHANVEVDQATDELCHEAFVGSHRIECPNAIEPLDACHWKLPGGTHVLGIMAIGLFALGSRLESASKRLVLMLDLLRNRMLSASPRGTEEWLSTQDWLQQHFRPSATTETTGDV